MLTAMDRSADRIAGLDGGADDYLVKPFDFGELLARLRALQRRPSVVTGVVLRCGDLSLDPASRDARVDNKPLAVTATELAILELLLAPYACHRDAPVDRGECVAGGSRRHRVEHDRRPSGSAARQARRFAHACGDGARRRLSAVAVVSRQQMKSRADNEDVDSAPPCAAGGNCRDSCGGLVLRADRGRHLDFGVEQAFARDRRPDSRATRQRSAAVACTTFVARRAQTRLRRSPGVLLAGQCRWCRDCDKPGRVLVPRRTVAWAVDRTSHRLCRWQGLPLRVRPEGRRLADLRRGESRAAAPRPQPADDVGTRRVACAARSGIRERVRDWAVGVQACRERTGAAAGVHR